MDILLTPAKPGLGLTEAERLDLGRLLLKAGYTTSIVKQRPQGRTKGSYEYYVRIEPQNQIEEE